MKIQVLITTMNMEEPTSLLHKINVKSSFVIGNQSSIYSNEKIDYHGNTGMVLNRNERGVGRNRNEAIFYSDCDICVLADDDMSFCDNYPDVVQKSFEENPDADVIIFNIDDGDTQRRKNTKKKRINGLNYLNYGAARLAFRRESVLIHGITFNTLFGGGCKFSCGEDSLFIRECLRKGLKIIALPTTIAGLLDDRESSWFKGYTDKFLFDQGVFLSLAHPYLCRIFSLLLCLKHTEYYKNQSSLWNAIKQYNKGISFVKRRRYAI